MKVALLSMQALPSREGDAFAPSVPEAWELAELGQTLALALHMRDVGNLDPVIFCRAGGELERRARALALPCMPLKSGTDLGDSFRIWKWQRKTPELMLLANGAPSLPCARRFLQTRRGKPVFFVPMFLARPPQNLNRLAAIMRGSRAIICGSDSIRASVEEMLEARAARPVSIHWIAHPAGLDLGDYARQALPYGDEDRQRGKHFVFGMADSLARYSGALLVARAMSAIWQTGDLPPWEVRMIGGGPRFEEVLAEALNLGVASRLSLLGSQFVGEAAAKCHVWLAPGSARSELPEIMGSAAAAGLPLVCSASPLHREWLRYLPPGSALEVGNDNPQELAKFMLALMREPDERARLARASNACRDLVGLGEMAAKVCAALEQAL